MWLFTRGWMIHLKGEFTHLPSSIPNWGLGEFSDRRERREESPNVQGLEQRLKNLLLKHGEAVKTPCNRGFMLIPKWFCWTMPCTFLRCVFPVEPTQVDFRFIHNKAAILRVCLIFRYAQIDTGQTWGPNVPRRIVRRNHPCSDTKNSYKPSGYGSKPALVNTQIADSLSSPHMESRSSPASKHAQQGARGVNVCKVLWRRGRAWKGRLLGSKNKQAGFHYDFNCFS